MDVWTPLLLLAVLLVVLLRTASHFARRASLSQQRRFIEHDPRIDAGLRGDRTGAPATFPRMETPAQPVH